MSKLRSVNTKFWSDPWVEELTPQEKLLYLYFITNEKTNMLGIYELSIRKISFETGIQIETIKKALEGFERIGKVKYTNNYIVLLNFAKHQNYNTNMKKSAIDVFNNLPKELKFNELDVDKTNPSKGFETVIKRLGMVRKIEVEVEVEVETELEEEIEESQIKNLNEPQIDFDRFKDFYNKNRGNLPECKILSDKRKKALKNRIKEHGAKKIQEMIMLVNESDFLQGENPQGWTATLDWILNKANFIKIIEGNYKNKNHNGIKQQHANNASGQQTVGRQTFDTIKSNSENWGTHTE